MLLVDVVEDALVRKLGLARLRHPHRRSSAILAPALAERAGRRIGAPSKLGHALRLQWIIAR